MRSHDGGDRRSAAATSYPAGMSWHDGPLASLDLEATGVDPRRARVVEVGLFRFETDGTVVPLVDRLVDPGIPLPAEVAELTGIRPAELAAHGGDPAVVLAAARDAIETLAAEGVPIVVYHATYDWPLLGAELARHGLGALPGVPPAILVDPLVLDRHVDRYRKGRRTLGAVAAWYGVTHEGAHRAAGDGAAAVGVARRLAERHPELRLDGADLVDLQVAAHRRWRRSFNAYLARIGASRPPVTEEWPGR